MPPTERTMRHLATMTGLTSRAITAVVLAWSGLATASIDGAGIREFPVESEPAGAEVFTITGHQGTTPLTLSERDIYPNSYPQEKIDQYGVVILRKEGCQDLEVRPGDSHIVHGLSLQLDCGDQRDPERTEPRPDATTGAGSDHPDDDDAPAASSDPQASRKLEQLRFLQQLLDEGLITAEEEATIRRRILEQP